MFSILRLKFEMQKGGITVDNKITNLHGNIIYTEFILQGRFFFYNYNSNE